jgi:PAS domain S-box-containing protein
MQKPMATLHVLIIDDNPENRLAIRIALNGAQATVSEAAKGAEGIEAARRTSPDFILLNCQLPDMDWLKVLENLVPEPAAPWPPVVVLTDIGEDAIAALALEKGAQDCLTKDRLKAHDLRRVIRNASDRAKLLAQHKRTEAALAASEARYRSIVEDQTEMVIRFRADGTLTFVNAAYARAFCRTPAALEGMSLYDFMPQVERDFVPKAIADLTPRNPVVTHTHRAFAADGSLRWEEWTNRLLLGSNDEPVEYQSTGRDITERKIAEEKLLESEARFRGTFENAAVGMAHVALDGRWLEVNDRLCVITGYAREELLAKTFGDITHPEDLAADLENARKLLAGEIPHYSMDKRYIRKDGSIVWIALTVALRCDTLGTPQYFISVVRDINSRKLAEEALSASEERLAQAVAVARIGIFESNAASHAVTLSPALREMWGFDANEEVMLEHVAGRILPEDRPAFLERIARARDPASDGTAAGEYRILHPSHGIRWVTNRAQAFCEGEGPARHWARSIGAVQDITERKVAEEELKEATARLRLALEAGQMGVWEWDIATGKVVLNSTEIQLLGYEPGSPEAPATASQLFELVHPEDRHQFVPVNRFIERLQQSEGHFYDEFRIIRPDGAVRWLAAQGELTFNRSGIAARMSGVNFDVTARKEAEQALRDSEERFRTIITTAQEGIWAIDRDAKTLFANPRMAELLGAPAEELIGKSVTEFCFPEDVLKAQERLAANFAGEKKQFEFRFRRCDGTPLYVLAATAPLEGPGGDAIGALGGFLDLAERKAAEDHQRFLMRELSHRSKNLLAIIQAMASLTARSAASLADFRERFLQRLQGIAASHDVLISQNWVGAPLAELVRHQIEPFAGAVESRVQLDGPNVSVSPSAAQALGLALHELATNSIKYGALSRPEGWVRVAWTFECNGAESHRLRLDWREHAGPPVEPPAYKGFGHAVFERMVAHSLGGTVMLDFAPGGFGWSISVPATHLVDRTS